MVNLVAEIEDLKFKTAFLLQSIPGQKTTRSRQLESPPSNPESISMDNSNSLQNDNSKPEESKSREYQYETKHEPYYQSEKSRQPISKYYTNDRLEDLLFDLSYDHNG